MINERNTHTLCRVKFDNGTSHGFEIKTCQKQGDASSRVLFNLSQGMGILPNTTLLANPIVIIGKARQEVAKRTNDLTKQ